MRDFSKHAAEEVSTHLGALILAGREVEGAGGTPPGFCFRSDRDEWHILGLLCLFGLHGSSVHLFW